MMAFHYFLVMLLGCLADARLPQSQTNGNSVLGTLDATTLPKFLTNNPISHGYPWGDRTVNTTDPSQNYPTTGVIRQYDWTISRSTLSPDGYERSVLLVNGAFPGPMIEANWGDTIQVTVHNNITGPEEGTAIHWHGFVQRNTPWEDGTPTITQCPIAPESSLTYQFQATLYGTSWYHSHYSAQYADGIQGPIVIYGPKEYPYDIDIGPIHLSDWFHGSYNTVVESLLAPGGSPKVTSINNLIQGKNNFDCTNKTAGDNAPCTSDAGVSVFKFTPGKVHRLRLINSGAEAIQQFSIDSHTMTVIAYDFVPVEAYDTQVITLAVGQRADVLVKADAGPAQASYWMRSNIDTACSPCEHPNATAIVYYGDPPASGRQPPSNSTPIPVSPNDGLCTNDDLDKTRPLYPMALPTPSWTHILDTTLYVNASNVSLWTMDGISFRGDYNVPTLLLASLGNTSWPEEWNARNLYTNTSVRIVVVNNSPVQHPMHLHGGNFYVLHEGPGTTWDGTTIVNSENPMRRDVQLVRPSGHLVLQFDATNPGVWPFHCHIAWHSSGGFFSQFIMQPENITQNRIPSIAAQTCRDWAVWSGTHIPDQIDSGI